MEQLTDILKIATQAIGSAYFQVRIAGGADVFRERVYCYELYHQMRCQWPPDSAHTLNGELDKRGHPVLTKRGKAGKIPDLLVHSPGNMEHNSAIIEVKTRLGAKGIKKDLDTLIQFREIGQYRRAIYLVFSNSREIVLEKIFKQAGEKCSGIELWHHSKPDIPADHIGTL